MKVLFVCIGNVNRSQIAEVIFNKLSKSGRATSAGLGVDEEREGVYIEDDVQSPVALLREAGYDASGAKVKRLRSEMVGRADKVVVIFSKKRHANDLPDYLREAPGLEWWDVESAGEAYGKSSKDLTREEYERFERKRIKLIEGRVKDLIMRLSRSD